jgi:TonB family protein
MKHIFIVLLLATVLGAIAAPQDTRPPLSKDEVLDLLNSSTPRKEIVTTINRYGIDFEPTDAALAELKKAGASPELLASLRKAWRPEAIKPLSDKDVLMMVAEDQSSEAILRTIDARGISFQPTTAILAELQAQGAKEMLLDALRGMSPRPFSKIELLRLVAMRPDSVRLTQEVQERGIDFEPRSQDLQALRAAGAQESLVEAVREAKRGTPFVPLKFSGPAGAHTANLMASAPLVKGKEATLLCESSDKSVPVYALPSDLGKIAASLPCGDKVTFIEKVVSPPGIAKILYAGGKEGFVSDAYLELAMSNVTPPVLISQTVAPYTPQARRDKLEGTVKLSIIIGPQGNVTDVQETSERLGDGLDESAIENVRTWKFSPARREGVPVAARFEVQIAFRLNVNKKP